MDFNLKKYRILKTKKYLKNSKLLFFFHSAKVKSKQWLITEKLLKKLKLNYYKTFNKTTVKIFNNSIYERLNKIICSIILFIEPSYKLTNLNFKLLQKELKSTFVLLVLKLNNKIYTQPQFKNLNTLFYKKLVFNFYNNLNKHSKMTYKLTLNQKSK